MYFIDTETCGRYGMAVLIQYALDEGEICLHEPWKTPALDTIKLIEEFIYHEGGICMFNAAFDWFHLTKLYTTFILFIEKYGPDALPEDYIDEIATLEKEARDGPCIKPVKCIDLMLHARKGPYQSTMNRDDIRIRRVPTVLAWELAKELDKRIVMKDIYFARSKTKKLEKWAVHDIKDSESGEIDIEFKDIVCKFSPSTALKALAMDALGVKEDAILRFADVECNMYPKEVGWAPFALATGQPGAWNGAWPEVIRHHIAHWAYNQLARLYAKNDIVYTRGLNTHFGFPVAGDDDSTLATCVASVRWRGFKADIEGIKQLRQDAIIQSQRTVRDPKKVQAYLKEVMNETEYLTIRDTTKRVILEDIRDTWFSDEDSKIRHPAALRAQEVLEARKAKKEVEVYDKLIQAGRFHASFVVIGTKSSRMSGTDGLNPQGINHSTKVRSRFPLAWDDLVLCGGDFSSFEVSLAAAVYNDPKLNADLALGKKMAGLFGQVFFPDMSYDEILESEGDDEDFYDRSKRGMYAFFYGGNEATFEDRIGIPLDVGKQAMELLLKTYPGIEADRKLISDMFCSMRQPGGLGTAVIWHEPADYIESPLGFRRYFTLENRICRALFELANKTPESWKQYKIKVTRRDRQQTAQGAVQSALYGAAFQIQAANLRAAANHKIQCFGSQITKAVQCEVWKFQPSGVNVWHVMPMNVHDEIDGPCKKELMNPIQDAVYKKVESYREKVPLIKIKWQLNMRSWKGKE